MSADPMRDGVIAAYREELLVLRDRWCASHPEFADEFVALTPNAAAELSPTPVVAEPPTAQPVFVAGDGIIPQGARDRAMPRQDLDA